MLAVIFGLITLFSAEKGDNPESLLATDSLKRHDRTKVINDTTGRFLQVNRIFIVGNKITRDQIVLRELTLKPGDIVYNLDLAGILDLDKKKLFNTRLFNTVDIRTLELEPDKIDLLIDLNERWYTFPSPIFELSDRNFNEWWQNFDHDFRRVNYGLRLYQKNFRGRNETLRFVAQFGYVRKFELSYRIPYIDKNQKQGLVVDFDFSETKNLAFKTIDHKLQYNAEKSEKSLKTTRGASITYTYRPSFYVSHFLSVGYRNVSISDSVISNTTIVNKDSIHLENPNYLGNERTHQQYFVLSYQFNAEHRDYIAYPLKGYQLAGFITKSGISPKDDLNKIEAGLTFSIHRPLQKNFFLSNNTVTYWSAPTNVPYANFGALGYRKQFVRGYEIYVIEGPYYFLNKTTLKKRIFSRTYTWGSMPIEQFRHIPLSVYLKTYADLGYVNNYPNYSISSRLTNKVLGGVGAGVDVIASYDVVLRFEYTFNAEGGRGFFFHVKKEF